MRAFPTDSAPPSRAAFGDWADDYVFDHLPVGVYVCAADGRVVRFNRAAVKLWGRAPRLGDPDERFCGSYRLFDLGGAHIPHVSCPMAVALKTGRGIQDQHIMIERPDGSRIIALVNINVIKNEVGQVMGAINVFRDDSAAQRKQARLHEKMRKLEDVLQALPAAIYTTDADGRITFYNEAAVRLWGVRPEIGRSEFCGSWKLFWSDGTPLPHDQCPMAIALKEGRAIEGMEAVAERPDGTRVPFLAFPTPLFDDAGNCEGAVNMLVDITGRKAAELAMYRLGAIVESSDDAILAKDLNGVITSWNRGAERIFGYTAEEAVGKPVTLIFPPDRYNEEPEILARIRRGERVDHYETVRQRKDGSLIDISLTVSPVIDQRGNVIGASKIARDITERRRAEEQQRLLLREMNHRIKNLFTLSSSLVKLSARSANSAEELATAMQARFGALARAHSLILPRVGEQAGATEASTTLHSLINTVVSPFWDEEAGEDPRVVVAGADVPVSGSAVTSVALLIHEFATNAAKYGALAAPEGRVHIEGEEAGDRFVLNWREEGALPSDFKPGDEGFGSSLARATISGSLGGEFTREFGENMLTIRLSLPRARLSGE